LRQVLTSDEGETELMRLSYLRITGLITLSNGYRSRPSSSNGEQKRKDTESMRKLEDMDEVLRRLLGQAVETIFEGTDDFNPQVAIIFDDHDKTLIFDTPVTDEHGIEETKSLVREIVRETQPRRLIFIGSAWVGSRNFKGRASKDPNRKEVIFAYGKEAQGEACLSQEIERKGEDITLGQIESDFFKVPWVSDLTFY